MTKQTQYTAGPWKMVRLEGRESFRLFSPETTSEAQAQANMALAESAPDLLRQRDQAVEALKALLSESSLYANENRPKMTDLCNHARATIASIEKEESL